jgi:hypothetical protein
LQGVPCFTAQLAGCNLQNSTKRLEFFTMKEIYIDHEKIRLSLALADARTAEEIQQIADTIAEMWIALGCPTDM